MVETQSSISGPANAAEDGKEDNVLEATIGNPQACASSATIGWPSYEEGIRRRLEV